MIDNAGQKDLRRYCERLAGLEDQKAETAKEIKELKESAKSDGFDAALIARTVRLMRMENEKRKKAIEQHDLFDFYLHAAGLIGDEAVS